MNMKDTIRSFILLLFLMLGGCLVGPDYHRPPPAEAPAAQYREQGWTQMKPADTAPKGDWWIDFHDPLLNQLEPLVRISNQTVKADYQNYREALALVREADAELFPTLGLYGSYSQVPSSSSQIVGPSGAIFSYQNIETSMSWTPDIWGQVRRTIEENAANAQSSEATLANAILSEQVTLATTVIELRVTDAEIDLLTRTVAEYKKNLHVIAAAVKAGYSLYPPSDEVTARTQLGSEQASLIALGVSRAQYVHAIAVLVGKNPEDLDIPHSRLMPALPNIPVGVPSTLLERRPDIAAAERIMEADSAAIGVATAALYPSITLSAANSLTQQPIGGLVEATATGTQTIVDFGQRLAAISAAKATYKSSVATYRATVLTAFQGVEDNLSGLRILEQQAGKLDEVVGNAKRGVAIAFAEYLAGTVDYTTVATAQTAELTDEQNALTVQESRLVDAVTLIGDLGGGWSTSRLHDPQHPNTTSWGEKAASSTIPKSKKTNP